MTLSIAHNKFCTGRITMPPMIKIDTVKVHNWGMNGSEKSLSLGAEASLQEVYEHPEIPELLHRSLTGWISWQKRSEMSVERVVRSPGLAPQWIASLLALGARVIFRDNKIPSSTLAEFLLRADPNHGKLVGITLPLDSPGLVWGETHVSLTPTDKPIVAAIAAINMADGNVRQARLALTGVWRQHARLAEASDMLIDGPLTEARIEQVVMELKQEVTPRSDFLGSADYRRAMAVVTARKALDACWKKVNQR
jgi:CO/xanthine dehydrogenase FAD-binding subunit